MKSIITRLGLLIAMLITILPVSAYDFESDGIYYNLLSASDRTCEITYGDVKYSGDFVVPSTVLYKDKVLSITKIGNSAFAGCDALRSISISDNITNIGETAFKECIRLESVAIPNSVKSLGEGVFRGCSLLNSVSLPSSISIIPRATFSGCSSLSDINIPETITDIDYDAFRECINLIEIDLPHSLENIHNYVFRDCINLRNINLPESIRIIWSGAFYNCKNLQNVTLPKSIKKISSYTFYGCRSISEINIPEQVSSIGAEAFAKCDGLTTITIPKNVTALGGCAFGACNNLTSVVFESSSEDIAFPEWNLNGDYPVFYQCQNLTSLTLGRRFSGSELGLNNISKLILLPGCRFEQLERNPYQRTIEEITYASGFDGLAGEGKKMNLRDFENLKSITVESPTPPNSPYASKEQRIDLIIYVPKGSVSDYQQADGWENFWEIREKETNEVSNINIGKELEEIERIDIHGHKANLSTKGIVIIRYSDGSSKKTIQK